MYKVYMIGFFNTALDQGRQKVQARLVSGSGDWQSGDDIDNLHQGGIRWIQAQIETMETGRGSDIGPVLQIHDWKQGQPPSKSQHYSQSWYVNTLVKLLNYDI